MCAYPVIGGYKTVYPQILSCAFEIFNNFFRQNSQERKLSVKWGPGLQVLPAWQTLSCIVMTTDKTGRSGPSYKWGNSGVRQILSIQGHSTIKWESRLWTLVFLNLKIFSGIVPKDEKALYLDLPIACFLTSLRFLFKSYPSSKAFFICPNWSIPSNSGPLSILLPGSTVLQGTCTT